MKNTRLLLWLFLLVPYACQEKPGSTPKPPYAIGFKIIEATDRTRLYKPNTDTTDKLHFRPVYIDVWYPATTAKNDSVLRFKDVLGLLEARANILSAPKTFPGLTQDIAKSFTEGFKCSQPDSLLQYPTRSIQNAPNLNGKFPLLIYLASYNALSYDNYILLEEFARQGYVVACVGSIGQYPGDMTMKTADLMAQVHDAVFTLDQMKKLDFVDTTRIGVVGYSWGGFAATILAMSRPEIDAVVSLDGSEFHRYGSSKEEDADFDATINSPSFKNAVIKVPYLRLESNRAAKPGDTTQAVVYNFKQKLVGDKQLFTLKEAEHHDFSSLPTVVTASGHCPTTGTYGLITDLTVGYFNQHLKAEKNAFQQVMQPELGKAVVPLLARR